MTRALRGITWNHPRGLASVRGAADEWSRLHPEQQISWDVRSLQGFADQPLDTLVDSYDLLVIDHPHIPIAARDGLVVAFDEVLEGSELAVLAAQSVGRSHASYHDGGHQYALAIDAAAQVAVYRPDLLPNPPVGWGEVTELAAAGGVLWPGKPVDAISSFLTIAAQRGTPVGGRDGEFIESSAALAVLDELHHLADAVPRECLDADPIEVAEMMSTGDDYRYAPLAFGYSNYSRLGFRPHRLRYRDMPADAAGSIAGSCLGGAGIAVSARSPLLDQAVDHARWLASATTQAGVYYDAGGQPANAEAWESDRLDHDSAGFFRSTRATLDGAWVRPKHTGWLDFQDAAGTLVNRALRRELDDARCVELCQAAYVRSREAVSPR
jgi:multiple sugar transport system substrate-binding protein